MPAPRADLMVLVKHAKPEVDRSRPSEEWELGAEGVEGALRLAERLVPLGVDLVVSSTEPKARQTAEVAAGRLDVQWQTGHDLHEQRRRSSGFLDGPAFQTAIRRLFSEPAALVYGEETADAAARRFGSAVEALRRAHPGRRLAVVAHGTVISLHLERHYDVDGYATWQALETPSYVVVDRRSRAVVDLVRSV